MIKKLESLGAFFIAYWWIFMIVAGLSFFAIMALASPKTVVLDERNWSCSIAVTDGLGTKCTQYIVKVRP